MAESHSIGKRSPRFIDLAGQTFGRLTVTAFYEISRSGQTMWRCTCSCEYGQVVIVHGGSLKNGHSKSCGCLSAELARARLQSRPNKGRQIVHGHSRRKQRTSEYGTFVDAKNRCQNPNNKGYPYYGGRGIKFNFASFREFLDEVGLRPTPKHSIDRIDTNGNYERGNVRWATKKEQANNRRKATHRS